MTEGWWPRRVSPGPVQRAPPISGRSLLLLKAQWWHEPLTQEWGGRRGRPGDPTGQTLGTQQPLTVVSLSKAENLSSQVAADFSKASWRLMSFSTSSTLWPISRLDRYGSCPSSQASATLASLENWWTSKTAQGTKSEYWGAGWLGSQGWHCPLVAAACTTSFIV